MARKKWELPEILRPEFKFLEKRTDKAISWVEKNRNNIHPSISFIEAMNLYDSGLDVTQLKPKDN